MKVEKNYREISGAIKNFFNPYTLNSNDKLQLKGESYEEWWTINFISVSFTIQANGRNLGG